MCSVLQAWSKLEWPMDEDVFLFLFNHTTNPNDFVVYKEDLHTEENLEIMIHLFGQTSVVGRRRSKRKARFQVALPPGSAQLKGRARWGARLRWKSGSGMLVASVRVVEVNMETDRPVSSRAVFGGMQVPAAAGCTPASAANAEMSEGQEEQAEGAADLESWLERNRQAKRQRT